MTNSDQVTEEAVAELHRRSRRTLAIVIVGMLLIVAFLLASVFRLQGLRQEAEDERDRYKALLDGVRGAEAAPPGERGTILRDVAQQADQSAAARPPQTPLEQLEVPIWYCAGAPDDNRAHALALRARHPAGARQGRPVEVLSAATNAQPIYRLARNEIRYNPAEEDAADRLQRMIRDSSGVDAEKVLTFYPTPGSISVFFCQGATLPPPPPPDPRDTM